MRRFEKIVLVDDDPIANYCNQLLLADFCEAVLTFQGSKKALEYLEGLAQDGYQGLPDAMLLDINMPVMDGWELLEKVVQLENYPRLTNRIALLSSSDHALDMQKAQQFGIRHYFLKPLTEEALLILREKMAYQTFLTGDSPNFPSRRA